jgi:Gpi18-like mannosyltransferase
LIVLYRFVEMEFDSDTAKRSILYLSIFPTALFFFAAYNESLFLFFMLLCFYTLRRGSWWLAGLFGGLATLTRSIGIFLFVIFLCEFARQVLPQLRQDWQNKQRVHGLLLLAGLPAALFILLGLGLYGYALSLRFGDPLAFLHAQAHWHEGLSLPWVGPIIALKSIIHLSPYTFAVPHDIIELTALGLFLILMMLAFVGPERFKGNQWTFVLFGAMALIYALIFPGSPSPNRIPYDPLPSMQRYVLEIFAGFIVLARYGRRAWFHQSYLMLSLPMLAFLVFQFITGHWTV